MRLCDLHVYKSTEVFTIVGTTPGFWTHSALTAWKTSIHSLCLAALNPEYATTSHCVTIRDATQ